MRKVSDSLSGCGGSGFTAWRRGNASFNGGWENDGIGVTGAELDATGVGV